MMRLYVLVGAVASLAAPSSSSSIVLEGDPPVVRVRNTAITARSTPVLEVAVDKPGAPALAGTYRVEPGVVTFTPRYPLQPGLAYRATFRLGAETATATLTPVSPAQNTPATSVERVYPTTGVWPENQLKFYIQFTAPMSRGEAFQRIHLLDRNARDAEIKLPFLEIDEELWDRDQKRLTVLFDPGRVKRGLVPNQEAGPPLVAGCRYLLVVDREWRDASNRPLAEAFRKEFTVGPAWRDGIDVRQWKIDAPPAAGTREPLRIRFPRSYDAALLLRCITIPGVTGDITLADEERLWSFTPDAVWKPTPQTISVLEILEDLAGNKVGRPFDIDRFERVDRTVSTGNVMLTFTPR